MNYNDLKGQDYNKIIEMQFDEIINYANTMQDVKRKDIYKCSAMLQVWNDGWKSCLDNLTEAPPYIKALINGFRGFVSRTTIQLLNEDPYLLFLFMCSLHKHYYPEKYVDVNITI